LIVFNLFNLFNLRVFDVNFVSKLRVFASFQIFNEFD